jgi:hypothetical protein
VLVKSIFQGVPRHSTADGDCQQSEQIVKDKKGGLVTKSPFIT